MTVTVHDSALAKSVAGSSVKVVGPAPNVAACPPVVVQLIVNQLPLTFTGSVKVIVIFAVSATSAAPAAGLVAATAGGASAARFCGLPGFGPEKSAALSSVSCVPPLLRSYELSPFVVGMPAMPVPSRQSDAAVRVPLTPSTNAPADVTIRAPAPSEKPVPYVRSPGTLPE